MTRTCRRCGAQFGPGPTESDVTFAGRSFCSLDCYWAERRDAAGLDVARFWARVDQSAGTSGCWPWRGALGGGGYGRVYAAGARRAAHRIALELTLDRTLATDELACHTCDNPPCCNPRHLFVGTDADNAADKAMKGRGRGGVSRGEANGSAKLTRADVVSIRAAKVAGESMRTIATRFGVSPGHIAKVVAGQKWAD